VGDGSQSCTGRGIVRGTATGPAIISRTPFSFLGDVDIRTGVVVGGLCDISGETIAGAVLLVPATRGSAGAWRFLYQLKVHGTHPVALVTSDLPDPSVVQGAILAGVPIVSDVPDELFDRIERGRLVTVDGTAGSVSFESEGP
jgi:predicted aconitase with swiveling domain